MMTAAPATRLILHCAVIFIAASVSVGVSANARADQFLPPSADRSQPLGVAKPPYSYPVRVAAEAPRSPHKTKRRRILRVEL